MGSEQISIKCQLKLHETWCRHWWMSFYISFQFLYFSIWILLSPAWTVYHEPDQENNCKAPDLLHADITVMHIQAVVVSDDVTYWWFTLYETSVYCWLIVYWSQALGNQSAVNKSYMCWCWSVSSSRRRAKLQLLL